MIRGPLSHSAPKTAAPVTDGPGRPLASCINQPCFTHCTSLSLLIKHTNGRAGLWPAASINSADHYQMSKGLWQAVTINWTS